jgi:HSP20 family protein
MPGLYIEKVRDAERQRTPVFETLDRMLRDTRQRAFELFQQRGGATGSDLEDWLRAERELLWYPPAELVEDETQFRLQLAVPGIEPGSLRITALPQSIIVRAEGTHQHDKREGKLHFCEFSERRLLRRFDLGTPIDIDRVSANLNNGVLEIAVTKAAKHEQGRPIKVNIAA